MNPNNNNPYTEDSKVSAEIVEPISKITNTVLKLNVQTNYDKACASFMGLEIEELETKTNQIIKERQVLEANTEMLRMQSSTLATAIDVSRKSLDCKAELLTKKTEELKQLQIQGEKLKNQCDSAYQNNLKEYEKIKTVYETYHPLHKEFKEQQIERLKLEVEYKMLIQKAQEQKKRNKLRRGIHEKIFYATYVNFAKNMLEYRKIQELVSQTEEAEKIQDECVLKLKQLKLLAVEKEKQFRQKHPTTLHEIATPVQFEMPRTKTVTSVPTNKTFMSPTHTDNLEERLQQIRSRYEQKLNQKHTFSTKLIPFIEPPSNANSMPKSPSTVTLKRAESQTDVTNQTPPLKIPKFKILQDCKINTDGIWDAKSSSMSGNTKNVKLLAQEHKVAQKQTEMVSQHLAPNTHSELFPSTKFYEPNNTAPLLQNAPSKDSIGIRSQSQFLSQSLFGATQQNSQTQATLAEYDGRVITQSQSGVTQKMDNLVVQEESVAVGLDPVLENNQTITFSSGLQQFSHIPSVRQEGNTGIPVFEKKNTTNPIPTKSPFFEDRKVVKETESTSVHKLAPPNQTFMQLTALESNQQINFLDNASVNYDESQMEASEQNMYLFSPIYSEENDNDGGGPQFLFPSNAAQSSDPKQQSSIFGGASTVFNFFE